MTPGPQTHEPATSRLRLVVLSSKPVKGAVFAGLLAGLAWAGQVWALWPVVIEVDGESRTVAVFRGSVEDALRQAGVTLGEGDELVPSGVTVAPGMRVRVIRAFPVYVQSDGEVRVYRAPRGTVADALAGLGIMPGPKDVVKPSLQAPLEPGLVVRVVRVREQEVVWRETVPYQTLRWAEPSWEKGRTGVLRPGREGVVEHRDLLRYEDGQLVSRTRLSSRTLVEKVDRIIGVGTRVVWRTINTPMGPVRYREKREMVATAYYPGPESTGKYADGLTATGMRAGHGVVAVDPRVIPLGTRLYIPGYGFAIAGDVGSAIKGDKIDLGYNTLREALHFGRRKVTVYVLD